MRDWFPKQTLGSLPERAAERWGAREALYFKGRRWSFADLSAGIDRLARGLIGLGVRPGEKVALWMVNRPEFIEAMFAVMKIGAVLVPVNTRLRTEDTAYILGQSDSAVLLIADRSGPVDYIGMVRELAPSLRAGAVSEGRFKRLRLVVSAGDEPRPETLH
ncbi:MAG: AMP-binding protein, partial [Candidatus Rokuibacteriota bacterium]